MLSDSALCRIFSERLFGEAAALISVRMHSLGDCGGQRRKEIWPLDRRQIDLAIAKVLQTFKTMPCPPPHPSAIWRKYISIWINVLDVFRTITGKLEPQLVFLLPCLLSHLL